MDILNLLVYLIVYAIVAVIIFYVLDLIFASLGVGWYPKVRPLLMALIGLLLLIAILANVIPFGSGPRILAPR